MLADPTVQRRLVELQGLDTAIARHEHGKRSLPEIEELRGLRSKRDQLTDTLVAAQTRLSDAQAALSRAEADLVPVRERLELDQKRVDAGQGDAKSLQATLSEIEHLHRRIGDLEDLQLEAMEEVEQATTAHAEIKAEHDSLTARGRELVAARDTKIAEHDARIADLRADRAPVAADIPADVMTKFEKLASRLGTGVGELVEGRTTCCGLAVQNADLARYQAAPANELLTCEECGRLLVRR